MIGPGADELEAALQEVMEASAKIPLVSTNDVVIRAAASMRRLDAAQVIRDLFDARSAAIAAMPEVPDRERVQKAIDAYKGTVLLWETIGGETEVVQMRQARSTLLAAIFGEG